MAADELFTLGTRKKLEKVLKAVRIEKNLARMSVKTLMQTKDVKINALKRLQEQIKETRQNYIKEIDEKRMCVTRKLNKLDEELNQEMSRILQKIAFVDSKRAQYSREFDDFEKKLNTKVFALSGEIDAAKICIEKNYTNYQNDIIDRFTKDNITDDC